MSIDPIERDAILLWCRDHAFTRWKEASIHDQRKYINHAQRLRNHMFTYEGIKK